MSSSESAAVAIIAVRNVYFKKYLLACEYLQIEPAKVYESDFIKTRIEIVRSQWSELDGFEEFKKLNKSLKWFEKHYYKMTKNGFSIFKFAKTCDKLVHKGKLIIHEGSVNESYVKCKLSQNNYDSYSRHVKRNAIIVIGVVLIFILLTAVLNLLQKYYY